ncbi:MAG: glutamate--tRNA ligase [Acidobacteriota bacterium]|nr:glutamate--tRNA ligase [Acidobacteriota bacterium]
MSKTVRTRIAPSPTGDPHVGTAYVALFNLALARHNGGAFVLRIEDTDRERSATASEEMILDALKWLGLEWDEGPDVGGPDGPYRQSERTAIYRKHVEELVASGAAYPCFCTRERLDALRAEQRAAKAQLGYDGLCRSLDPAEAGRRRETGEPYVTRLAMPREGETVAEDLLRGEIRIANDQVDDQVLLKSDGHPTYHLANVVDDHLMGITHVIRAEEWISSLPKHVRLYEAFGWDLPVFCHLPLLRNSDKSKISKRKNPVSIKHYETAGILPEALVNYLAQMGWTMPDERDQFTLDEFISEFRLEDISLGGPVFDLAKLNWLNGKYLRDLSVDELLASLRQQPLSDDYLMRVLPLVQERIDTLADFVPYAGFFFAGDVEYDPPALPKMVAKNRTPPQTAKALRVLLESHIDGVGAWNAAAIEEALRSFCDANEWSPKELFMPVRIAVTGRTATPPLFETMEVLGKERCRRRLRQAIETLRTMKS